MREGRSKQISFRADDDLADKIAAAAIAEELSLADFVRKVFRFGFREYETAGSLHALKAGVESGEAAKRGVETDRRAAANVQNTLDAAREKRGGGKRKAG